MATCESNLVLNLVDAGSSLIAAQHQLVHPEASSVILASTGTHTSTYSFWQMKALKLEVLDDLCSSNGDITTLMLNVKFDRNISPLA